MVGSLKSMQNCCLGYILTIPPEACGGTEAAGTDAGAAPVGVYSPSMGAGRSHNDLLRQNHTLHVDRGNTMLAF